MKITMALRVGLLFGLIAIFIGCFFGGRKFQGDEFPDGGNLHGRHANSPDISLEEGQIGEEVALGKSFGKIDEAAKSENPLEAKAIRDQSEPVSFPAKRQASALDTLVISGIIATEWPTGEPVAAGWYPRVRIVESDFKAGLLRIEENVEMVRDVDGLHESRALVEKAADARHVLVAKRHADALLAAGYELVGDPHQSVIKLAVARPDKTMAIPQLLADLRKLRLDGVEPDAVVEACALSNDPLVGNGAAWHLENLGLLRGHKVGADISAKAAWDVRTDARGVLIALVDSGVAEYEPEILPALWVRPGETFGDGIDDDNNGFIDDVRGYDFYHRDAVPEDESGHGTSCAMLMGAAGNNSVGSSGVAWQASILNCKFLNGSGLGTLSDAIDAIAYARESGADILNLSWSYPGDAPVLREELAICDAAGMLIVCASGNSGYQDPVPAPASIDLPHLVAVAASTSDDRLASFSVVDPSVVDIAAPGTSLAVQRFGNANPLQPYVRYESGTSFSAALISGSLALGRANFPGETPMRTLARMLETATPIPGGAAALVSGGRLNLGNMLGLPSEIPGNGLFAGRLSFTDSAGQWTGRNDGEHLEDVDTALGLSPDPQGSVWFEWTAANDGLLRIVAEGPAGNAVGVSIFSPSNGQPGALRYRSADSSILEIPVTSGEKLIWMVDSAQPVAEGLRLYWHLPPANDNLASAIPVSGVPALLKGNSLGATVESFEETTLHFAALAPPGSLWWKWTPATNAVVNISATGNHLVFLLESGTDDKPIFTIESLIQAISGTSYLPEVGKTYYLMAVPQNSASAGPFDLTVSGAEDFILLSQPQSASVLPGESVEIGFAYTGRGILGIQWFRNDQAIPFAGEETLRFSPLSTENYGSYYAEIRTGAGVVSTETALISPREEAPRVISQVLRRSVVDGQSVSFSAAFNSASPITYVWKKDGALIPNVASNSYFLPNATTSSAGTYSLTATNSNGSTTVSMPLEVISTPWHGWVNRTPGKTGGGKVFNVSLIGDKAAAFTSTECRRSADGGATWSPLRMPAGFVAQNGQMHQDGSLLVSGYMFPPNQTATPQDAVWKYSVASGWIQLSPRITLPGASSSDVLPYIGAIYFSDGKWWCIANIEFGAYPSFSTDGENWSVITDAGNPNLQSRATRMFVFDGALAIHFWEPNSKQAAVIRQPGGSLHRLPFVGDVRTFLRVGTQNYASIFLAGIMRAGDADVSPTVVAPNGTYFPFGNHGEGYLESGRLIALEDSGDSIGNAGGSLVTGIYEKTFSKKAIGFTSYAKSGDRWLVGYKDGSLWMGTDLTKLPVAKDPGLIANPRLNGYRDEWVFGGFHSSDGARWQRLGARLETSEFDLIPMGQAGSGFFHSLRAPVNGTVDRRFFSPAMWPSATERSASLSEAGIFASGANELVSRNDSSLPFGQTTDAELRRVRPSATGLETIAINLAIDRTKIEGIDDYDGRWFLRKKRDGVSVVPNPIYTSGDGLNWQSVNFPVGTVFGKNGGTFLCIQSATGGYKSNNGTAWTPIVLNGLPAGKAPTKIVSYRGYFVASVETKLYASQDGISWAESSPPLPVGSIETNRHTLLVVSMDEQLLQPGGVDETGPWIEMPRPWEKVTVMRHSGFLYKLAVGDDDGDLVGVDCYLNGVLTETKTAAPFDFSVNPSVPGVYAVEFAAKDSKGRVSRVTSRLEIIGIGLGEAQTLSIDSDLSKAFLFKGEYYRVIKVAAGPGVLHVWQGENRWKPVSPAHFNLTSAAANSSAIVAVTTEGLLVSRDALNWELLGGLVTSTISVRGDVFFTYMSLIGWSSADGYAWEKSNVAAFAFDQIVWANERFGFLGGSVTYDGGNTFYPLVSNPGTIRKVATISGGVLFLSEPSGARVLYRLLETDSEPVEIARDSPDAVRLFLGSAGGLAYFGKAGEFMRSTVNGIDFADLALPGNRLSFTLHKLGGEWFSISSDAVYQSPDLSKWTLYKQFPYNSQPYATQPTFRFLSAADDSLLIEHSSFPTKTFVIREGVAISDIPRAGTSIIYSSLPDSTSAVGLKFKGRWIAMTNWWYSKPEGAASWERVGLQPSPGFVQPISHAWPTPYVDRYSPGLAAPFAASSERYIAFRQDRFNAPLNYVITSVDGFTFRIHSWTGSIPLADVTRLAASESGFLATASGGRVLISSDGLTWSGATVISPGLEISAAIWFGGKWHVCGRATVSHGDGSISQGQIWSSADAVSWALTGTKDYSVPKDSQLVRSAFASDGIARLYAGSIGWMKSTDGIIWTDDAVSNAITLFPVRGAHPEGVLASFYGGFSILDSTSGQTIRSVTTGAAGIAWLNGTPFTVSPGRFDEWIEADPRLTGISAVEGNYGVGDFLEITLNAAELPESTVSLGFFLSADTILANGDDVRLGVSTWASGQAGAGGARSYRFPLPPEISAGRFRVGAVMRSDASDSAVQNNRITSGENPVLIPGYQLQLTRRGEGDVSNPDPRTVYPKGATLQLEAIPANGYTMSGWDGSLVSTQAAVALKMDADKSLMVSFVPGYRVIVRAVGSGRISGVPGVNSLPPGTALSLSQQAADGWVFDGWMVNGAGNSSVSLEFSPSADTLIEGVFVPDFAARRATAFAGQPAGASRLWNGDPDGDGLTTWQEILLGSSPTLRQSLEDRIERSGQQMRLLFTRPQGPVSSPWVQAEFSDKLADWDGADGLRLSERVLSQRDGMETVEVILPYASGKSGFFRLKMRGAPEE